MTCIRCEVTRAKLIAVTLACVGNSNATIAAKLRDTFGAEYYVASDGVLRASSVPPFTPYRILTRNENG